MDRYRDAGAERSAGTPRLRVCYDGVEPDMGGYRSRYAYRVSSTDPDSQRTFSGNDLFSGVGAEPSSEEMVRTLASFLEDAGERYQAGMCAPDAEYPAWLYEAAYLNSDELALLDLEREELDNGRLTMRYVDVVFQKGEAADEAMIILDEHGEAAAVAYLAQWDSDTGGGRRSDDLPAGSEDHVYIHEDYVLSYSLRLGYIGLSRRVPEFHDENPPETTLTEQRTQTSGRRLYDFPAHDGRRIDGPDLGSVDAFGHGHTNADPGL